MKRFLTLFLTTILIVSNSYSGSISYAAEIKSENDSNEILVTENGEEPNTMSEDDALETPEESIDYTETPALKLLSEVKPISERADYKEFIAIHNRKELEAINNNMTGKYYLTNDIDLAGAEWIPIGIELDDGGTVIEKHSFRGVLDGQGHTIKNMTIKEGIKSLGYCQVSVGLIGEISEYFITVGDKPDTYAVENLILDNVNIDFTLEENGVGAVVGKIGDGEISPTIINNISVTGNIKGDNYVGGIVGSVYDDRVEISNCANYANVTTVSGLASGIVSYSFGKVSGCVNYADIRGQAGIVGETSEGHCAISDCVNYGNIDGFLGDKYYYEYCVGGIAGSGWVDISGCKNYGIINTPGDYYAGGIAGISHSKISDCENHADIQKELDEQSDYYIHSNNHGGIVGKGSEVENCTNEGKIFEGGGIAGIAESVSGCINNGATEYGAGIAINENGYGTITYSITDCTNYGIIKNGSGIAGYGEVSACENYAVITIDESTDSYFNSVGGIVGSGSAYGCTNYANIYVTETGGGWSVGGISGSGSCEDCINKGNLSAESKVCLSGIGGGTILRCRNEGNITSKANCGGIAASADIIDQCVNTGNITVTDYFYRYYDGGDRYDYGGAERLSFGGAPMVGGIAAYASNVSNCYNTGNVSVKNVATGNEEYEGPSEYYVFCAVAGGITGFARKVVNSYNTGEVIAAASSGIVYAGGITGSAQRFYDLNLYTASYVDVELIGNVSLSAKIKGYFADPVIEEQILCREASSSAIANDVGARYKDSIKNNLWRSDGAKQKNVPEEYNQDEIIVGSSLNPMSFYDITPYEDNCSWDFSEIWEMPTRGGLPVLKWENLDYGPSISAIEGEEIENSCIVTYETNGGTPIAPSVVRKGQVFYPSYATYKDGYIVENWYLDEELTTAISMMITVNGDITLYAKWVKYEPTPKPSYPKDDGKVYHVKSNYFMTYKDGFGDPMEFDWTFNDFKYSAMTYNHRLAIAGLALCASANSSKDNNYKPIDEQLRRLGFDDDKVIHKNYEYNNFKSDHPGISLASKTIKVDGKQKVLIAVVIRGTTSVSDIKTDLKAVVDGFKGAGKEAERILTSYIKTFYGNKLNADNTVFFITGHSLGGATAARLMQEIDGISDRFDTYVYTYASPNYDLTDNYYDNKDIDFNIHTIINVDDSVPNMVVGKERLTFHTVIKQIGIKPTVYFVNKEIRYNRKDEKATFDKISRNITGIEESYNDLMNSRAIWNYLSIITRAYNSLMIADNNTRAAISHAPETYMAFLLAHAPTASVSPRTMKRILVECPVDVSIYDQDDNFCGSVIGGEINYPENTDIIIETDGDKKYILMPYGDDYRVELTGTDTGTMRYSMINTDVTTGEVVEEVVYDDVALTAGKTFISQITPDETPELFVTDENGEPVKQVETDGTEKDYYKYGEVLPEDVPESGIIPDGIWIGGVKSLTYDGSKQIPTFRVYDGTNLLVPNTDYKVSCKNNKNAYVIENLEKLSAKELKTVPQITLAMKGNYSGKKSFYFSIETLSIEDEQVFSTVLKKSGKTNKPALVWNGKELKKDKDYSLLTTETTVTFTGIGNFKGTRVLNLSETSVTPKQIAISKAKVSAIPSQLYTGLTYGIDSFKEADGVAPFDFAVTYDNKRLALGVDYRISKILNARNVGKATIVLEGLNAGGTEGAMEYSFVGERRVSFDIKGYPMTGDNIIIKAADGNTELSAKYNKAGATPKLKVMFGDTVLKEGRDYTLKYSENMGYPAAKAQVMISGKGNFTSKTSKGFTVTQRTFSSANGITVIATDKPYSNKANQYATTVKVFDNGGKLLKAGTDYEKKIIYLKDGTELDGKSHPEVGDVITVRVTGKGGYSDNTIETTYRILATGKTNDLSKATIKIKNQDYNKGKPVIISSQEQFSQATIGKQKTALSLSADKGATGDFVVVPGSYVNNLGKGTAQVTFMGVNEYSGTKTVKFKIGTRSILDMWFGWF